MPLIKWSEEYSVGVKEFDDQHKTLIDLINQLSELYAQKKFENTEVSPVLEKFSAYAHQHLENEEHYFELFGYPQTEGHIKFHDQFREKAKELREKYEQGDSEEVLFEINNFLYDWWTWHIKEVDKGYTSFFNANGLK